MSIRFDTSFKGALGRTCEAAGEEISRGLGAAAGAYAGLSPYGSPYTAGILGAQFLTSKAPGGCEGSRSILMHDGVTGQAIKQFQQQCQNAADSTLRSGFVMCASLSAKCESSGGITLYEPQGGGNTVNAEVGFDDDAEPGELTEDDVEAAKEQLLANNNSLSPEDADEAVRMAKEIAGDDKAKFKKAISEFNKLPSRHLTDAEMKDKDGNDKSGEQIEQEKLKKEAAWQREYGHVVAQLHGLSSDQAAAFVDNEMFVPGDSKQQDGNLQLVRDRKSPGKNPGYRITNDPGFDGFETGSFVYQKKGDKDGTWYSDKDCKKPIEGAAFDAKAGKLAIAGDAVLDSDDALTIDVGPEVMKIKGTSYDVYEIESASGKVSDEISNGTRLLHDPYKNTWYQLAKKDGRPTDDEKPVPLAQQPKRSADGRRLVFKPAMRGRPVFEGLDVAEINKGIESRIVDFKKGIARAEEDGKQRVINRVDQFEKGWKDAVEAHGIVAKNENGEIALSFAPGKEGEAAAWLADSANRKTIDGLFSLLKTVPPVTARVNGSRISPRYSAADDCLRAAKQAAKLAKPEKKKADAPNVDQKAEKPEEKKKVDGTQKSEEKKSGAPAIEATLVKEATQKKVDGKDYWRAHYVLTTMENGKPKSETMACYYNAKGAFEFCQMGKIRVFDLPKGVSEAQVPKTITVPAGKTVEQTSVAQKENGGDTASFKSASDDAAQSTGAKVPAPEVKAEPIVAKTPTPEVKAEPVVAKTEEKPSRTALTLKIPVDLSGKSREEAQKYLMDRVDLVSKNSQNLLPSEIDVGTIKVDGNITEREFASMLDAIAAEYKIAPGEVFFSGKQGEFKPGLRAVDKPVEENTAPVHQATKDVKEPAKEPAKEQAKNDKIEALKNMLGGTLKGVGDSSIKDKIEGAVVNATTAMNESQPRQRMGDDGATKTVKIEQITVASSGGSVNVSALKEKDISTSSNVASDADVVRDVDETIAGLRNAKTDEEKKAALKQFKHPNLRNSKVGEKMDFKQMRLLEYAMRMWEKVEMTKSDGRKVVGADAVKEELGKGGGDWDGKLVLHLNITKETKDRLLKEDSQPVPVPVSVTFDVMPKTNDGAGKYKLEMPGFRTMDDGMARTMFDVHNESGVNMIKMSRSLKY